MNKDTAQHGKLDLRRDAETNVPTVTCECGASETFGDSADVAYKWWLSHLATLPPQSWPTPVPPPPEVSAGADVVAVLAEVLGAIRTYDPLMFTDQHRALFEWAAEKAEAPPETGPHSQPPKRLGGYEDCSTTDGFDVAAVLARLVEEMQERERQCNDSDSVHLWHRAAGIEEARAIVEAAQATTGARAAGGEKEALHALSDRLLDKRDWVRANLADTPKHTGRRLGLEEAAGLARGLADELASAPPAPSAPGVAELLAECARQNAEAGWGTARISCDEIVRMLAPPEGGQS